MSFPPSLQRYRKNLDQSSLWRNSLAVNIFSSAAFATNACYFGEAFTILPSLSATKCNAQFKIK